MSKTHTGLDGWTPRAFADALGLDELTAERLLDETVGDGLAVRISQGATSVYVPGASLGQRLDDLGIVPVEGERLAARQRELRERFIRDRARRMADKEADR